MTLTTESLVAKRLKPLQSNLSKGGQSWNYETYFSVNNSKLRLRARLKRDAYDQQSYALVELLDMSPIGNKTWVEIYKHPINELEMHGLSYTSRDESEVEVVMRMSAHEILEIACMLL